MGGAEYRPERGYYTLEEKAVFHFENLKESLQWKDGQPPDPLDVHEALATIVVEVQPMPYRDEVVPPDHEAFIENMRNVRDAFGFAAYPHMSEEGQQAMRYRYTPSRWKKGEITITPQQKRMLTMITTAAGIPDDPARMTYSYRIASRPSLPGNGQEKGRR